MLVLQIRPPLYVGGNMKKRKARNEPADNNVTDYRHKNVTRLNIPPARLAARGKITKEKKIKYAYNPHLAPNLRFDATAKSDRIGELIEKAGRQKLESAEIDYLEDAFRNHLLLPVDPRADSV